jgi:hypothetical protein
LAISSRFTNDEFATEDTEKGRIIIVISTGGPVVSARSGEIWSRVGLIYRPRPDVSTALDMTGDPIRLKYEIRWLGHKFTLHERRVCDRGHRGHRERTDHYCHLDRRAGRVGPEWRDLVACRFDLSSAARCLDWACPEPSRTGST